MLYQLSYASPSHPGNSPGVPKKTRTHCRSAHTTAQIQRLAYRRLWSKPAEWVPQAALGAILLSAGLTARRRSYSFCRLSQNALAGRNKCLSAGVSVTPDETGAVPIVAADAVLAFTIPPQFLGTVARQHRSGFPAADRLNGQPFPACILPALDR